VPGLHCPFGTAVQSHVLFGRSFCLGYLFLKVKNGKKEEKNKKRKKRKKEKKNIR
jgi:hypothetical protein